MHSNLRNPYLLPSYNLTNALAVKNFLENNGFGPIEVDLRQAFERSSLIISKTPVIRNDRGVGRGKTDRSEVKSSTFWISILTLLKFLEYGE